MKRLFKQVRQVSIGKMLFDYEQFDIDFEVQATDDKDTDIAVIELSNLSEDTKIRIKKDMDISVAGGYEELSGNLFNGTVDFVETIREGADFITKIMATPNNRQYTNTIINVQFRAGIKASEILAQLENMCNFKIDIKGLAKDPVYPKGKAFSNRLSNVVAILAKDTGTVAKFTNTTIEFREPSKVYTRVIKLSGENGLISVNRKQEGKEKKEKIFYEVESLLIPLIKPKQLLDIKATNFTGRVVVKKCTYRADGTDTFSVYATTEVVE